MAGERIPLQGLQNTRDLGGYRTQDGRMVKPKRLIRSGALAAATPEDLKLLAEEYGLLTVVDFRTRIEREQKPDPQPAGVRYVVNSILNEEMMGITHERENTTADHVESMIAMCREVGEAGEEYLKNLYPVLVTDDFCVGNYRAFFELLLEQEEGALLYHCSEGKDRVGTATALVLSALGVERQTILNDYLLTNEYTQAQRQRILSMIQERLPEETALHNRFLIMNSVREDYLVSIFDTIDREYGSMDCFLQSKLLLTSQKRERLKELYLTEANG